MEKESVDLIIRSLPLLLQGAGLTMQILIISGGLSLCLGTLFGLCSCQRFPFGILKFCFEGLTFVLRAVPFYVQLLIVYFVLPDIFSFNLSPFAASVVALGVCSGGYVSQVVRCGINSIPKEQWEAAYTLGYSTASCMRYIIYPQMIRNVLPALTNELDSLLKSTAILSSIGLLELTRMGMNIVSREMTPLVIYLLLAVFYVLISALLNLLSRILERKFCYVRS